MHNLILSSVQITEQLLDLVSHASILEKIRVKTETEIVDKQAGFRQGRGNESQNRPTDAQGTRAPRIRFVDFKKAFDSISHDKLWVI